MDLKTALGPIVKPITQFAEETQADVRKRVEQQLLKAGASPERAKSEADRIAARFPSGPGLVGMLATLLIPGSKPLKGALSRIVGGATAAGLTAKATGQPAPEAAEEFALQQASGEALFGLGRGVKGQATGRQLFKDRESQILADKLAYQQAQAARRETIRQQQIPYRETKDLQAKVLKRAEEAQSATHREALESQAKTQQATTVSHEAAVKAQTETHAATQSQQIGDLVKSQVPPFKGVPSTPEGLWRMAYGPEWYAVNERYDTYLTEAIRLGRGQELVIPEKAARELGVPIKALLERGPLQTSPESLVTVDGGLLAGGMKGQWKTHRASYNAGARAIDEANIGNSAERAIYRNAMSFRMFMDRSQALEGQTFHPDRVLKYLGRLKANQEVLGPRQNVPLYKALESAKPPTPIPTPSLPVPIPQPSPIPDLPRIPRPIPPPIPMPPTPPPNLGIVKHEAPVMAIPGLAAGAYAGHLTGIPHLTWAGAIAGEEVGRRLGPRVPIYTGVPRTSIGKTEILGRTLTGEGLRQIWDYIQEP